MLIHPMKFHCCFHCSSHADTQKVEKLLSKKFDCEGAWLQARDHMLRPILQRIAEASEGYMPVRWTDARTPLPAYNSLMEVPDDVKRHVHIIFWRLCRIVRYSFEEYVSGNNRDLLFEDAFDAMQDENAIESFYRMVSHTRFITIRDHDHNSMMEQRTPEAISFQICLVNNEDKVMDTLYNLVTHKLALSKVSNPNAYIHSTQ